ncbi:MAG: glycerophosphodiester phosphodiesterase family protein [Acidobacteriota bacterium]|nr:MAG: glycerophosphodiester phosphodiesterase family protein [Acidobacteriota bacterium]
MKCIVAITALLLTVVNVPVLATQAESTGYPDWAVVSVAHRGGIVPGYPENTLEAFRQAIEHGAQAIEIDLRGTKDGEIVIMHDETVDRTTNGSGRTTDLTTSELKRLDAGYGRKIPTYEETLELVAGTGVTLLLDIKESPDLDRNRVVRITEHRNAVLNVIVGVRNLEDLRTFRILNPNLRILGFIPKVEDVRPFVEAGVDIIRLWPRWIAEDPGLIKSIHSSGIPVWATAGDAQRGELERLVRFGVNGILTDFPALLSALLDDLRKNRNN